MEIIMRLIVLFYFIPMVKLRTSVILPRNLLTHRNGQDCWSRGNCSGENDRDFSKNIHRRAILKNLQQNFANGPFLIGNNTQGDGGSGFHKSHRTHRYHHRLPITNNTEDIHDGNHRYRRHRKHRRHRRHRKRHHRKRHLGSNHTSHINSTPNDDYVGVKRSLKPTGDIVQDNIVFRKNYYAGHKRSMLEDEILSKKVDELEKKVEKHSHLVHNLVTRNRKASRSHLVHNLVTRNHKASRSHLVHNLVTRNRKASSSPLVHNLVTRNQKESKRAFLPSVQLSIPNLYSRYPYLQKNRYSSPAGGYAQKYLSRFSNPVATLPVSRSLLCSGANAETMFGSKQGCSPDIVRLQNRINMIKKSYRIQQAHRRQQELQQYAGFTKSRISKPFYNLQGSTPDQIYPEESNPYISVERKIPDGMMEDGRERYENSKLSNIQTSPGGNQLGEHPSVAKLAQLVAFVRGIMDNKRNAGGTVSRGAMENMNGDLINSLSAALSAEGGNPTISNSVLIGEKRQYPNELVSNGQVDIDPTYPGSAPSKQITTALKPFFTLRSGQGNLPTLEQRYAWALQNNEDTPSRAHVPTTAVSTVPSQKLVSKSQIKISPSLPPTAPPSPLEDEYSKFVHPPTKHIITSNFTPSKTKQTGGETTSPLTVKVPNVKVDGHNSTTSYNKSNADVKDDKTNVSSSTFNETTGQKGESLRHTDEMISIDSYVITDNVDTQINSEAMPSPDIKYALRGPNMKEPDTQIRHRDKLSENIMMYDNSTATGENNARQHKKENDKTMSNTSMENEKPNKLHSNGSEDKETFIRNMSTPKQQMQERLSHNNEEPEKTEVNMLNPRYPHGSSSTQQPVTKVNISDKYNKTFTEENDREKWNVGKTILRNPNKTRISSTQRVSATTIKEGRHLSTHKEKPTKGKWTSTHKYTKDSGKGAQVQIAPSSSPVKAGNIRNSIAGAGKQLPDKFIAQWDNRDNSSLIGQMGSANLHDNRWLVNYAEGLAKQSGAYYKNKRQRNHTSDSSDSTRKMFNELGSYYTGSYYTDQIDDVLNHRVPNTGGRIYNYRTVDNTEIPPDIRTLTNTSKEDDKTDSIVPSSIQTTSNPATEAKRSRAMYNSENIGYRTNTSEDDIPIELMNLTFTTRLPSSPKTIFLRSPGIFDNNEKSAMLSSLSYPMYPTQSVVKQGYPLPEKQIMTDIRPLELFNITTLEKFSSPENVTSQLTLPLAPIERLHDSIWLPPKLLDNPNLSRLPTFPLYSVPFKSSTKPPMTQPHIALRTTKAPKTPSYSAELRDYLIGMHTTHNGSVSQNVATNTSIRSPQTNMSNGYVPKTLETSNENSVRAIQMNGINASKSSNTQRSFPDSNVLKPNLYDKPLSNNSKPNISVMWNENSVSPIQINDNSHKATNIERYHDSNMSNQNFYLKPLLNNSEPNISEMPNENFAGTFQVNEDDPAKISNIQRILLDARKERENVLDSINNNNIIPIVETENNGMKNFTDSDLSGARSEPNFNKMPESNITFDDTGNIVNDFTAAKPTERPKATESPRKLNPQVKWGDLNIMIPTQAIPTRAIRPKEGRKWTNVPLRVVPTTKKSSTTTSIIIGNVFQQQLTSDFPLGEAMKMDDMYWTDSRDEIEDTCKEQKGTDLVINILAFGDSLTRGYYNNGRGHHPYTMKLQYLLNNFDPKRCFIIDNEGKDGEPAFGEMPKRMETVLSKSQIHYNWAIILGGTNDIYNKVLMRNGRHTAKELSNNIISIHELAQSRGIKTVVVTIPEVFCKLDGCQDMREMREMVNEDLRQYANQNKSKTLLCDIAGALARRKIDHKLAGQVFEGGLHLRPRGYETMARLLFESFVERIYAT